MKILKSLRDFLLKIARTKSPFLSDCISGWTMYKHTKTFHSKEQNIFKSAFYGNHAPYVLGGPFRGMLYENRTYFGPVTPRWIGSYEKELHTIISSIHHHRPDCIVDIGAAEGYYSVGLARNFPSINVVSYETNPLSLWHQRTLKALNKAENLLIQRYCSHEDLCRLGDKRCFILSDIEGGELDLFSEEVISKLTTSIILIELHSHYDISIEGVASVLEHRFRATHSISFLSPAHRSAADIEIEHPPAFSDAMMVSAMNEHRSQLQKWMYCVPTPQH